METATFTNDEMAKKIYLDRLRDEFAVHAPECPTWFYNRTRQSLGDPMDDDRFGAAEDFNDFADANAEINWPYYWADLVLQTRSVKSC